MLRSVIVVFSYWCVFRFFAVIVLEILSMIMGDVPFSVQTLGATVGDVCLSLLVGLIGIYVTRPK